MTVNEFITFCTLAKLIKNHWHMYGSQHKVAIVSSKARCEMMYCTKGDGEVLQSNIHVGEHFEFRPPFEKIVEAFFPDDIS